MTSKPYTPKTSQPQIMTRWSKLQSALYNVMRPDAGFQIHCSVYRMPSGNTVPRYWITIGGRIMWDFPRCCPKEELDKLCYPYCGDMSFISQAIRDYINCPKEQLTTFNNNNGCWGLIDILKSCDRRLSGHGFIKQF